MDDAAITLLIDRMQKKYGPDSLFRASDRSMKVKHFASGLEDWDREMLGIAKGRLLEFFGMYSSGKTSLATQFMARYSASLIIDAEGTFDIEHAQRFGADPKRVLVQHVEWGEQAFEVMFEAAEAGMPLIVVDSVPSLVPRKEAEEENFEKAGKVGAVANLMSRKLPTLSNICRRSGTTIIFINQIRNKMGVFFGDPFDTPGGYALKHNLSLKVRMTRKEWLNHPRLGTFGQITKAKIIKAKTGARPNAECELMLIFERGFINFDQLPEVKKELLKHPPEKPVFAAEVEDEAS